MSAFSVRAVAFSSAVLLSGAAFAAPITVSPQGGNIFGSNGKVSVTINSAASPDVGPLGVQAGGFAVKGDLDGDAVAENFTAFCVDISHFIGLPSLYNVLGSGAFLPTWDSARQDNVQSLFNTAFSTLNLASNTQSGGFQLALWEILYETDSTLDVSSGQGNFTAWGNAGAIGFANGLLAGLGGPQTQSYKLTFLQSTANSQHLVTASPVPVPAAGLMLLAGLGGLAALARRRKAG